MRSNLSLGKAHKLKSYLIFAAVGLSLQAPCSYAANFNFVTPQDQATLVNGTDYTFIDSTDLKQVLLQNESQAVTVKSGAYAQLQFEANDLQGSYSTITFNNQGGKISAQLTNSENKNLTITQSGNTFTLSYKIAPKIPTAKTYTGIIMKGINLSGAEAGGNLSAWVFQGISTVMDAQYYMDKGMNTVRFPINWNYITSDASSTSPTAEGQNYISTIKQSLSGLLGRRLYVVVDLHNYMRFEAGHSAGAGNPVTKNEIKAIWTLLGTQFASLAKKYPEHLLFEISNEPYGMDTTGPAGVVSLDQAGVDAIRALNLKNPVVVEGNAWSGLHSWFDSGDSDSNAKGFISNNKFAINDPDNNVILAVHEYFDSNGSGSSATCQAPDALKNYVNFDKFIAWARKYHVKVMLDEFGSGGSSDCLKDVNWLLNEIKANPADEAQGGFVGWTAWVAGHTWAKSNFNYIGDGDSGQMNGIYKNFLNQPQTTQGKLAVTTSNLNPTCNISTPLSIKLLREGTLVNTLSIKQNAQLTTTLDTGNYTLDPQAFMVMGNDIRGMNICTGTPTSNKVTIAANQTVNDTVNYDALPKGKLKISVKGLNDQESASLVITRTDMNKKFIVSNINASDTITIPDGKYTLAAQDVDGKTGSVDISSIDVAMTKASNVVVTYSTAPTPPETGCQVTWTKTNGWSDGKTNFTQYSLEFTTDKDLAHNAWNLQMADPGLKDQSSIWNATASIKAGKLSLTANGDWENIQKGVPFNQIGMIVTGQAPNQATLNGGACKVTVK